MATSQYQGNVVLLMVTPHEQSAKCIKQTEFSDVTKMMDLWATKACKEGVQLTGDVLRVKWKAGWGTRR